MPLSDLKIYAEVIEIGFKIGALIIGGCWAIYGLVVFKQRQSALTALRKTEAEAANLDLAAKRRAVLDISIKHDVYEDPSGQGFILSVQIVSSNGGVAPAVMTFEGADPPLRIQRVDFDDDGTMTFSGSPKLVTIPNAGDPTKDAKGRLIRAGGTSRIASVIRIKTPGIYAVSFRVPMDESNRQAMVEARGTSERIPHWSATTFVPVGITATSTPPALPGPAQR